MSLGARCRAAVSCAFASARRSSAIFVLAAPIGGPDAGRVLRDRLVEARERLGVAAVGIEHLALTDERGHVARVDLHGLVEGSAGLAGAVEREHDPAARGVGRRDLVGALALARLIVEHDREVLERSVGVALELHREERAQRERARVVGEATSVASTASFAFFRCLRRVVRARETEVRTRAGRDLRPLR